MLCNICSLGLVLLLLLEQLQLPPWERAPAVLWVEERPRTGLRITLADIKPMARHRWEHACQLCLQSAAEIS